MPSEISLESPRLLTPPPTATASQLATTLAPDAGACKLLLRSPRMKALPVLAATLLLFATTLVSPVQSTNTTSDSLKRQGNQTASATTNSAAQQISEANEKARAEFTTLGQKLDELKAKARTETGEARAALEKAIAELQKELDDLKPTLDNLRTATTNAWGDIKSTFDQRIKDIQKNLP
jgi:DNA anti-recombination protein RmuC